MFLLKTCILLEETQEGGYWNRICS